MEDKYVALTFDDGPNTVVTPAVLERLEKYGIVATFFVNGVHIDEESAKVMKKAFDMGCEIENHSQNHKHMNQLTAEEITYEIDSTDALVENTTGEKPIFFRPPFIDVNDLLYDTVDKVFICGYCPDDWSRDVSKEKTAQEVLKSTKNGNIILLHDSDYNLKTALSLDLFVPQLLEQGYKFVTVKELFNKLGVTPKKGLIYSNVFDNQD